MTFLKKSHSVFSPALLIRAMVPFGRGEKKNKSEKRKKGLSYIPYSTFMFSREIEKKV